MEFFIASSDAAEGFEASKEVLDAVTFAIEMLVKSGFGSTIGPRGYDGEAAKLIHKSTDGVAVVSFVHDGMGVGFEVSRRRG